MSTLIAILAILNVHSRRFAILTFGNYCAKLDNSTQRGSLSKGGRGWSQRG